jgi:two-component system alkaline phosphatase synthesis response regulator PhoP
MGTEKRILVVDDDDAIRALVRTVLRRRGWRVDVARNGVEALQHISLCHYALIVLDLMMPLMSGYEVLEHVATLAPEVRPYVLVLTAGLEPRVFDKGFVLGTIHKPFDISLLLDTVTGVLQSTSDPLQAPDSPPHGSVDRDTPN